MKPWATKIVSTELRKILAYRSDFWVNFIGQMLIQLFIARALWSAIFESNQVSEMRGMTLAHMTLYYLLSPLVMKILMGENIGFLAREIYDGGINRYLVWPLSALKFKSLTYLTYSSFYLFQMVLLYLLAYTILEPAPLTTEQLLRLLMAIPFLLTASLAYFFIMCLCEMVAFWADNTWTLGVMMRFVASFLGGTFLPLSFYPEWLQATLHYLPFSNMIASPIQLILGQLSFTGAMQSWLILLLWIPVLSFATHAMWRRGSYQYTGVGM